MDLVLEYMKRAGVEITRENYLAFCYPVEGDRPEEIDEEMLPEELRLTTEHQP